MVDGFESHSVASHCHRVVLLLTVEQHRNALPVVLTKLSIVVGVEGRTLTSNKVVKYIGQLYYYVNSSDIYVAPIP